MGKNGRNGVGTAALLAAAVLLLASAAATADEFSGEFEGRGVHLELDGDGESYMGALVLGEEVYLCEARRGGGGLVGSLEGDDGSSSAFTLRAAGGRLVLESRGESHTLWPLGEMPEGGGDAAGGGPAAPREPAGAAGSSGGSTGGAPGEAALAGRWQGAVSGTPAILALEAGADRLSGRLDVSGYLYDLEGTLSAGRARGRGTDTRTGASFEFEAAAAGDAVELVLLTRDPQSGGVRRQPMVFRRAGAETPPGDGDLGVAGSGGGGAVPPGSRDPSLVGLWRHSQSMTSGDTSLVTESFIRINADGTWAMGGGRAVGGGASWGGDTGSGGVEASGYWKSENRVVYVQAPGTGQWQPFARYYLEPGKLMFTYFDNTRQVLYRAE